MLVHRDETRQFGCVDLPGFDDIQNIPRSLTPNYRDHRHQNTVHQGEYRDPVVDDVDIIMHIQSAIRASWRRYICMSKMSLKQRHIISCIFFLKIDLLLLINLMMLPNSLV